MIRGVCRIVSIDDSCDSVHFFQKYIVLCIDDEVIYRVFVAFIVKFCLEEVLYV